MFNKSVFLCLSAVLFTSVLTLSQTLKANWWENLEGASVKNLADFNQLISEPMYKNAKATTLFMYYQSCPHSIAEWKNYQDGFNQFALQYPEDTFQLLHADLAQANDLAHFYKLKTAPAFLIFENGQLHYIEEEADFFKNST